MKLLQTTYDDQFEQTIQIWAQVIRRDTETTLFHVYAPYELENSRDGATTIRRILNKYFPGAPVIGCSASGEIFNGRVENGDYVISVTVFEDPDTRVELIPYYMTKGEQDTEAVMKHARSIPHLRAVELITAAPYPLLEEAAKFMDRLPEDVEIFGGVAAGDDKNRAYVFAGDGGFSYDSSAVVLYSGPELHILTSRMFGWKAIGYPLTVTRSEGPVVYELDGKPAYDVYNHYLHIKKDESFFYDALDFPWEVRPDEETALIRHAKSVNPDGSIVMSCNIPQGSEIRITYGDPREIMTHTRQTTLQVRDFGPEVVYIVNCMGRKLFWGKNEGIEVDLISKHMRTMGFSALGEIMRFKGTTLLNNLSIVTVAMREGEKKNVVELDLSEFEKNTNIPVTARLAIFINTISEELMEKNRQLHKSLYRASHDALTGLLNRGALDNVIYEFMENHPDADWHLVMFDVDDFKKINDNFGHTEGDRTLRWIAEHLSGYLAFLPDASFCRWGGEEFMVFVGGGSDENAKAIADKLLEMVKEKTMGDKAVTISVGVTRHRADESVLQTTDRVDELMYRAKNSGKAKVCSDL